MIRRKSQFANQSASRIGKILLAAVIPSSIFLIAAFAKSGTDEGIVAPTVASSHAGAGKNPASMRLSPYRPVELPPHAQAFYVATLGVDSLALKAVESGLMIRFSYRVVNAEKADPLNNKKINPYLVDEQTHRALVIPTLEKVGELRQSGTVEVGKVYWMLFSNKGDFVKTGSRVSLVFGKAHIDGLVVQ